MKLLLFSPTCTSRLQYICNFIFSELWNVDFEITSNAEDFKSYDGVKINYSQHFFSETQFHISPVNILFEQDIHFHKIDCFETDNKRAFFKTNSADFAFDILAASFYLLSRYEEYLPHQKDIYGRYAHENSLAYKEGFLNVPLINIWIKDFVLAIQNKFPEFSIRLSSFVFIPTYDIDIAYSYRHKGFTRNTGGFLKSPSFDRIGVLLGVKKDPFDTYDWLNESHEKLALKPIYFFLVAAKNSQYDKNILPANKAMKSLIKTHAKKYTVGLHPSWQSGDEKNLLKEEKEQLALLCDRTIGCARQHYIRFNLPGGYRNLLEAGFTDDYSMGYGSINGFRASVASSFKWFDLEKNEETALRIHPFCYMEANSYFEQKLSPTNAFEELMHYFNITKLFNATLITIWHNHMVGADKVYKGWGEMYEKFLNAVYQ